MVKLFLFRNVWAACAVAGVLVRSFEIPCQKTRPLHRHVPDRVQQLPPVPRDADRRRFLHNGVASLLVGGVGSMAFLSSASAATGETTTPVVGTTVWMTGKSPKIPGQKPRDKNDLTGTKKDPNFLRSIADCRNQCEKTLGPDGLPKAKEDCLSDCQDICCTTYEQCTFAIVPRI